MTYRSRFRPRSTGATTTPRQFRCPGQEPRRALGNAQIHICSSARNVSIRPGTSISWHADTAVNPPATKPAIASSRTANTPAPSDPGRRGRGEFLPRPGGRIIVMARLVKRRRWTTTTSPWQVTRHHRRNSVDIGQAAAGRFPTEINVFGTFPNGDCHARTLAADPTPAPTVPYCPRCQTRWRSP